MQAAAIDVGSNTLRLLIGDVRSNILSRLYTGRVVTRLAEGIGDTGFLRENNMRRSVSALRGFSRAISEHRVSRIRAVGTSALRDAGNSPEFVDMVLQETGICIEIITGRREAELTARGIFMGAKENGGVSLIFDIGGGSTEWILSREGESLCCGSLHMGVVNLLERFIRTDPPSSADVSSVNAEIDGRLLPLKREIAHHALMPRSAIGTGGTITTLAAIDLRLKEYDQGKVHRHRISDARLSVLRDMLLSMPLDKRRDTTGLEPDRADLIIPGILLTIRLMDFGAFPELEVSDYGLLEGLIKEMNDENSL